MKDLIKWVKAVGVLLLFVLLIIFAGYLIRNYEQAVLITTVTTIVLIVAIGVAVAIKKSFDR